MLVAMFVVGGAVVLMGSDAATVQPTWAAHKRTRPHPAIAGGAFADATWSGQWTRPHTAIAGGPSRSSRRQGG
jgi:hypothetical protein